MTHFSNDTLRLASTFLSNSMAEKWQRCCLDAIDCCLHHLRDNGKTTKSPTDIFANVDSNTNKRAFSESCPRTWDGWTCWADNVPKGQTVGQQCPDHIYWKITAPPCRGSVTKICNPDGRWFSKNGREWSNYTNCARDDVSIDRETVI